MGSRRSRRLDQDAKAVVRVDQRSDMAQRDVATFANGTAKKAPKIAKQDRTCPIQDETVGETGYAAEDAKEETKQSTKEAKGGSDDDRRPRRRLKRAHDEEGDLVTQSSAEKRGTSVGTVQEVPDEIAPAGSVSQVDKGDQTTSPPPLLMTTNVGRPSDYSATSVGPYIETEVDAKGDHDNGWLIRGLGDEPWGGTGGALGGVDRVWGYKGRREGGDERSAPRKWGGWCAMWGTSSSASALLVCASADWIAFARFSLSSLSVQRSEFHPFPQSLRGVEAVRAASYHVSYLSSPEEEKKQAKREEEKRRKIAMTPERTDGISVLSYLISPLPQPNVLSVLLVCLDASRIWPSSARPDETYPLTTLGFHDGESSAGLRWITLAFADPLSSFLVAGCSLTLRDCFVLTRTPAGEALHSGPTLKIPALKAYKMAAIFVFGSAYLTSLPLASRRPFPPAPTRQPGPGLSTGKKTSGGEEKIRVDVPDGRVHRAENVEHSAPSNVTPTDSRSKTFPTSSSTSTNLPSIFPDRQLLLRHHPISTFDSCASIPFPNRHPTSPSGGSRLPSPSYAPPLDSGEQLHFRPPALEPRPDTDLSHPSLVIHETQWTRTVLSEGTIKHTPLASSARREARRKFDWWEVGLQPLPVGRLEWDVVWTLRSDVLEDIGVSRDGYRRDTAHGTHLSALKTYKTARTFILRNAYLTSSSLAMYNPLPRPSDPTPIPKSERTFPPLPGYPAHRIQGWRREEERTSLRRPSR
ncbi:hypothetical protein NMY22_g19630 [Coprinellus aureogranulatus]|nr:hypothetical protein NMY22_g19630 [Coprinellus aureogranulatus]